MSNKVQRVGSRGPYSTGAECFMVPRDPTLSALLLIQHILCVFICKAVA